MELTFSYFRFFKGKTPYSISKVGMTILAKGLADEIKNTGNNLINLDCYNIIAAFYMPTLMSHFVEHVARVQCFPYWHVVMQN